MAKQLTRSRTHRVVAGVCGGIAEYFNLDVTLVRLVTAVTCLFWGAGILAYGLAWLLLPEEGTGDLGADKVFEKYTQYRNKYYAKDPVKQAEPPQAFDPYQDEQR